MLPSQTSFPVLWDEQSKIRDTTLHILYLHSQIRATHWIYFLCQVFLFVCLPWQCIHQSPMDRSALQYKVEQVPCTLHSGWGWKTANECSLTAVHYPYSFSEESKKKRCKNVENVWLNVSVAGLHMSDSFVYQRNTIALKTERVAVLYIKWCLFSILTLQVTSEGTTSTGFCTYMINVNSSLLI